VGLHGKDIGAVEEILIRIRVVGLHPLDEFILAQHLRLARLIHRLGDFGLAEVV
jgi:hypothetical protein